MFDQAELVTGQRLDLYTTLKAGGKAELFYVARTRDELSDSALWAQSEGVKQTILGWGSNVLPSDAGVAGFVTLNSAIGISVDSSGLVEVDTGAGFQNLFLKTAQAGLGGFEFAVGIPGTVGGALVSNAGAYRNNISAFLTEIEVVWEGRRRWLTPEFLELSYRDSVLRQVDAPAIVLLAARFQLEKRDAKQIYDDARDYQRQRIGKQPPSASAGSFFKNVVDNKLAQDIEGLTPGMQEAGVIPAGFLIERCGLKGKRFGGAMIGARHANFMLNVGGATASEIRRLAEHASAQVRNEFGVNLEEEALYLGNWQGWENTGVLEL
ncbi:MAG: UDP-N-acetylmuramate dehydrogenase [Fimbriimonadaceae bacterium]